MARQSRSIVVGAAGFEGLGDSRGTVTRQPLVLAASNRVLPKGLNLGLVQALETNGVVRFPAFGGTKFVVRQSGMDTAAHADGDRLQVAFFRPPTDVDAAQRLPARDCESCMPDASSSVVRVFTFCYHFVVLAEMSLKMR